MKRLPDPNVTYPIPGLTRTCYLRNIVSNPRIVVGDFTYYDDPNGAQNFEKNVLHLFSYGTDRLVIGNFTAIAAGVRFIMNGSNHQVSSISTFPFNWLDDENWGSALFDPPHKGDTEIGSDVWIGDTSTFMQGVKVGHGSIIATNSVVTKDVAPYSVVGGNPATLIRRRFSSSEIDTLLEIAWWDWPIEKICQNVHLISSNDVAALRAAAGL